MVDLVPNYQGFSLGNEIVFDRLSPVIIAGPCAIESAETVFEIAESLKRMTQELDLNFVFKASFDKANRTSIHSFRSIGFEKSLDILRDVKQHTGILVLTDVHETHQVGAVADIVDILQIPAFLCRQTDLLTAAGETGLPINIKRGQFIAAEDMYYAVEKVRNTGNDRVFLTERGYTFGYHDLVVDFRAFPIMRRFAPVVFDITHSVQQPGGTQGKSGGDLHYVPYLARAGAAVGVDGFFIETHPRPDKALSDGPNMVPLSELRFLLESIQTIWQASLPFITARNSTTDQR